MLLTNAARSVAILASITLFLGCAATQPVRVLPKGERRFISSIGGPVLPNQLPTPALPYTNIGVMWGRTDALTLSANVHVLAAAFGVAGIDVGAARRLRRQSGARPEVTAQAQIYAFTGDGGTRIYPNLTPTASWSMGRRGLLYGGSALTVRPTGGTALIASPLLGVQRDLFRRLTLQLEGKWMAANIDMSSGLFEGESSVNGNGGLALQLGLQVKR